MNENIRLEKIEKIKLLLANSLFEKNQEVLLEFTAMASDEFLDNYLALLSAEATLIQNKIDGLSEEELTALTGKISKLKHETIARNESKEAESTTQELENLEKQINQ